MKINKKSFIEGEYNGTITNNEIISLKKYLSSAKSSILILETKIKNIQDDCEHIFQFSYQGAYEDLYVCTKCGFEIEK